VRGEALRQAERAQILKIETIRAINEEIRRLESKGPNPGRAKQVRLLRKELQSVEGNR
jgi:hypothetical protein